MTCNSINNDGKMFVIATKRDDFGRVLIVVVIYFLGFVVIFMDRSDYEKYQRLLEIHFCQVRVSHFEVDYRCEVLHDVEVSR